MKNFHNQITAVVLVNRYNEHLVHCLNTLQWCNRRLVLGIENNTYWEKEVLKLNAVFVRYENPYSQLSFAQWRNFAQQKVKTKWTLFIDVDERVTPQLASEIIEYVKTKQHSLSFLRQNYCYGQKLSFGGWQDDWVTRLIFNPDFIHWYGNIHESINLKYPPEKAKNLLIHLTHQNTKDNLIKSANWTIIEAQALAQSLSYTPGFFLIVKKGLSEFIKRALIHRGYRDGLTGLIEALVQAINRILVYIQVWEIKQKPSIKQRYFSLDKEISKQWEKSNLSPINL